MRFLADMGVDTRIVRWLRSQGHDAIHLREESLQRMPDERIFEKAISEGRVILTFDLDFGEIVAFSKEHAPGVILFRLRNTRTPHVTERLASVLEDCSQTVEKGAIVIVEEARHRVRDYPVRRA